MIIIDLEAKLILEFLSIGHSNSNKARKIFIKTKKSVDRFLSISKLKFMQFRSTLYNKTNLSLKPISDSFADQ